MVVAAQHVFCFANSSQATIGFSLRLTVGCRLICLVANFFRQASCRPQRVVVEDEMSSTPSVSPSVRQSVTRSVGPASKPQINRSVETP